jgi:DNA-binding response OmpR family regulator
MPEAFSAQGLFGCRILIVEDRYLVADDLQRLLSRNGAEIVAVVADADQAKRLAASGDIDLAVLDVDLRGQDVFEVAATLAARKLPFLFVTGLARTYLPERYRAVPMVTKPFSEPELLARISEVLDEARGCTPSAPDSGAR